MTAFVCTIILLCILSSSPYLFLICPLSGDYLLLSFSLFFLLVLVLSKYISRGPSLGPKHNIGDEDSANFFCIVVFAVTSKNKMALRLGSIQPFNSRKEDWSTYRARVEQFLVA